MENDSGNNAYDLSVTTRMDKRMERLTVTNNSQAVSALGFPKTATAGRASSVRYPAGVSLKVYKACETTRLPLRVALLNGGSTHKQSMRARVLAQTDGLAKIKKVREVTKIVKVVKEV